MYADVCDYCWSINFPNSDIFFGYKVNALMCLIFIEPIKIKIKVLSDNCLSTLILIHTYMCVYVCMCVCVCVCVCVCACVYMYIKYKYQISEETLFLNIRFGYTLICFLIPNIFAYTCHVTTSYPITITRHIFVVPLSWVVVLPLNTQWLTWVAGITLVVRRRTPICKY